MRWLKSTSHRFRSLFRKNVVERELDQELRFHLERQIAENIAAGMTPEEARRRATREFGGVEQMKEQCRDERRVNLIETLLQDIRYGARALQKNPGFTFFAVVVLALGIAANTAIFSIADTVLLRPLPYPESNQLVMVWEDAASYGFPHDTPSAGDFSDWSARNEVFEDMAAMSFGGSFNLTGDGNPEEIPGKRVTANLFSVLGVKPALGRDFRAEEDIPGTARVAIFSHGLWLRRFGADAWTVGKEIQLNYEKYTVIGVMRRGFQFPDREAELWVPAQFTKEELANHGNHFLNVVARLKPGIPLKAANANLSTIAKQIEKEHPEQNAKIGAYAVPLREEISGDSRPAILVLSGAVCFVLLIACANVANLLLARASGRRREMAMRLTLGASRGRVIRQMLTESVLLATLGGSAGLLFSFWGTPFLASLIPAGIAPLNGTEVSGRVLLFTLVASIATGILFGIMPALRVSGVDLVDSLKQGGGRSGVGSGGRRLRDALVVCEVALAIVLLSGAALMIRSLENLYHLDPGFRADHVLVMRTPLPRQKYEEFAPRKAFYDQVLERVGRVPGVIAAGYTTWIPLTNAGGATGITIENQPAPEPGQRPIPNVRIISKDYIRALRMKLIKGRLFDEHDGAGTQAAALINETMAREFWHGADPVGTRFKCCVDPTDKPAWITVVGIVGDVHQAGLDIPARPEMYQLYQQQDFGFEPEYLAVRTSGDPMLLAEAVRKEVWTVDKEQPVAGVMPLEDLVDDNLAPRRIQASLLGGFAGMALLLASLGIYAVLSFAVAQRTQEIGVRVALGAEPGDVLHLVFSHGLKLFMIGAALGLAAALALSRTLTHLLYGVSAYDPVSFASVTILLAGVTLLACYIPARRATRVDPMVALRYE
jgi:putative ABC transport system permease protein